MATHPTPKAAGFHQPAEWEKHDAVWLAYPSHGELWQEDLWPAQAEFKAFAEAIADVHNGVARGEKLNILVPSPEALKDASKALAHLPNVSFHQIPFGDIWLRDTAPIFLRKGKEIASARFKFNSWGGKYDLPYDDEVAGRISDGLPLRKFDLDWILEGGSVEVDGEGTCLTSRQCLLNPNRNKTMSQSQIEEALRESLGVEKILWVGDGLVNDHTDGHIDTIARLVGPGKVLCMKSTDDSDPNKAILEKLHQELSAMTDARGRKMEVGVIPSPGGVVAEEGESFMPASYLNFYIANTTVIVPVYGAPNDAAAVKAIAEWFPGRRTVGLSAKSILTGGGAFHCISQQQPAGV